MTPATNDKSGRKGFPLRPQLRFHSPRPSPAGRGFNLEAEARVLTLCQPGPEISTLCSDADKARNGLHARAPSHAVCLT